MFDRLITAEMGVITGECAGIRGEASDLVPAQLSHVRCRTETCFFTPKSASQVKQMLVFKRPRVGRLDTRTSTQDPSCWANWPVMLPSPRGMCEGPQLLRRPGIYITLPAVTL